MAYWMADLAYRLFSAQVFVWKVSVVLGAI